MRRALEVVCHAEHAPEVLNGNDCRVNLDFISGFPVNSFNSSTGPESLRNQPIDVRRLPVTQSKEARAQ